MQGMDSLLSTVAKCLGIPVGNSCHWQKPGAKNAGYLAATRFLQLADPEPRSRVKAGASAKNQDNGASARSRTSRSL